MINVNTSAATTAELVAAYNELTGKSIKKFSSRAAGERQVTAAQADRDAAWAADAARRTQENAQAAADAVKAAAAQAAAKAAVKAAAAPDFTRTCPGCGATQDITPAGLEGTAAADRNFCHNCSTEWFPATGKAYNAPAASPGRAAAIAASWADPAVAAARANRASVTVSGGELKEPATYGSVAAAFRALNLPMGKHIKFRGQLKADGTLVFDHFTFVNNAS